MVEPQSSELPAMYLHPEVGVTIPTMTARYQSTFQVDKSSHVYHVEGNELERRVPWGTQPEEPFSMLELDLRHARLLVPSVRRTTATSAHDRIRMTTLAEDGWLEMCLLIISVFLLSGWRGRLRLPSVFPA